MQSAYTTGEFIIINALRRTLRGVLNTGHLDSTAVRVCWREPDGSIFEGYDTLRDRGFLFRLDHILFFALFQTGKVEWSVVVAVNREGYEEGYEEAECDKT